MGDGASIAMVGVGAIGGAVAAAHWLRCLIGPDTRVGVMQNGIDHVERISDYVEGDRAVPCIILLPSPVV